MLYGWNKWVNKQICDPGFRAMYRESLTKFLSAPDSEHDPREKLWAQQEIERINKEYPEDNVAPST